MNYFRFSISDHIFYNHAFERERKKNLQTAWFNVKKGDLEMKTKVARRRVVVVWSKSRNGYTTREKKI